MLQMITESIEAVGSIDRMAIADHIRKNKFKTLIGEISVSGQNGSVSHGRWASGKTAFSMPCLGSATPSSRRSS